jgi:molybdenum cofactor synthesis domain-containing protein
MEQIVVKSVNISGKKGTIKLPVDRIKLDFHGVQGDAHAGSWHRQVSLLGTESIDKFSEDAGRTITFGEFAENITTEGALLYEMRPFDRLVGEHVELEVTQIGKKCHGDNCSIFREVGNCVMPKEGIFARVLKGGHVQDGDVLTYHPRIFRALIITLSDRASKGEYEDKSGPLLAKLLTDFFTDENRKLEVEAIVIPDEAPVLQYRLQEARETGVDLVFTTGGTGIGPRDITPDVVSQMLDKELPGIMEMIRLKYGAEKPNALLSRGVAGMMGKTLVFTLPGSPKAVNEYCTEIFRILNHAFLMLGGIDGH